MRHGETLLLIAFVALHHGLAAAILREHDGRPVLETLDPTAGVVLELGQADDVVGHGVLGSAD
jgi:hypothetical protein